MREEITENIFQMLIYVIVDKIVLSMKCKYVKEPMSSFTINGSLGMHT